MKFSIETLREVWNDDSGDHIEVGPDRDNLNLVELRYKSSDGKIIESMSFPPQMARLVCVAVLECANELDKSEKKI